MEEKSIKILGILLSIISIGISSIFILFFIGIARVDATSWVQIYPKSNVNDQYISNSNSSRVRFRLCNNINDTACKSGNYGGWRFSYNWNTLAFAYMQDATINKNDTVNFELQFEVTAIGLGNPTQTNWDCNNWGHGAVALVGNRAGTQQTISNRQWARSSCTFSADSKNSSAIFTFSGSYTASTAGTKVAFLFGSNIDLKPASSNYAYDITYVLTGFNMSTSANVQVDVGAIINNQNSNTQNIIMNNDKNTQIIGGLLEDIMEMNNWEQQNPDTSKETELEGYEGQLANYLVDDSDISNLDYSIDTTTNQVIWQIFTNTITGNQIVYTTILTILFLGIIKLILAR